MPETLHTDAPQLLPDPPSKLPELSKLSDIAENSCLMAIDSLLAMLPGDLAESGRDGAAAIDTGKDGGAAKGSLYPLSFMASAAAQIADCMITTTRDFQTVLTDSATLGATPLRHSDKVA